MRENLLIHTHAPNMLSNAISDYSNKEITLNEVLVWMPVHKFRKWDFQHLVALNIFF